MKFAFIVAFHFLFSAKILGQSFFEAEGKLVKTGTIERSYNFAYKFGDSVSLFFTDSIVKYSDPGNSVVKTVSYFVASSDSVPSVKIDYLDFNGRDSISKYYNREKLSRIYQNEYDEAGRIIYYGMKSFNNGSGRFDWFSLCYEYHDSLISTGKFVIKSVFNNDSIVPGGHFLYRELYEYDAGNRLVKKVPEGSSTVYIHDENDSLYPVEADGMEMHFLNEGRINSSCDQHDVHFFPSTDFDFIRQLSFQLLLENRVALSTDLCESFLLTLVSPDRQAKLSIVKRKPYWCEGRVVHFSTIQKL